MIPVIHAPHIATEDMEGVSFAFVHTRAWEIRNMPYLPNLRRMAAKIIDPATGASTCALGSHRCVRNKGIFTIKAIIDISHHREAIWSE